VIPTTTVAQNNNPWAVQLSLSMDEEKTSWAICDKPMTVSTSRLFARRKIPRLEEAEFNVILGKLLDWLPKLPTIEIRSSE
jgi:mRNA interferase MazF